MEFTLEAIFSASRADIYTAWTTSNLHTEMTGGEANCSDKVGESFDAWGGYISGKNLELIPNEKIVQTWRTTEFSEDEDDSHIEVTLEEHNGQTKLTLVHNDLPEHGEQYINGWKEHYFTPMKEYFSS